MGIIEFFKKSKAETERRRVEYRMERLKESAKSGNRTSAYELGSYYYEGKVIERNPVEAVKWYTEAARCDCRRTDIQFKINEQPPARSQAFEMLAKCYRDGTGVQQNLLFALELFGSAFSRSSNIQSSQIKEQIQASVKNQGGELLKIFLEKADTLTPEETFFIANICYYYGDKLLPNVMTKSNKTETAMSFFKKSYQNGYIDAAWRIAHIIRYNYKKPMEALEILKEGAERGGLVSQHELGDIYSIGNEDMGIEKNEDISVQWYKKVCENTDINFSNIYYIRDSAYSIGLYYWINDDLETALNYFKISTSQPQFANPFDYSTAIPL